MDKLEKFLIFKKGTTLVEVLTHSGMGHTGEEIVLMDLDSNFDKAVFYNTEQEAIDKINIKRKLWDECNGELSLYWYDNETVPDDLGVLKITIEE